MFDRRLNRARSAPTLGDPDFDLRAANRNQSEFSSDEEGVGGDECDDPKETQEREPNPWSVHSPSARDKNHYRRFRTDRAVE
jgi:hypothetical protein